MTSSATDACREESTEFSRRLASSALKLARLFADGATLWCVAPGRADDALHVAVEFVHPVIVGKRALPAVSVLDSTPSSRLRRMVGSGDVVLCIGSGEDETLVDLCRRCPAWGAEAFWIGWGPAPSQENAALLWLVDETDSDIVRTYHLLWELVHVCLEQPDVLGRADTSDQVDCAVCADESTLAEIASLEDDSAVVRTATGMTTIDTSLLDNPTVNDLVLVHAGVALGRLEVN